MSKEGRYFTQVKELDRKCYLMKRGTQHLWSDVHWHPRGEGGRKERGGVGRMNGTMFEDTAHSRTFGTVPGCRGGSSIQVSPSQPGHSAAPGWYGRPTQWHSGSCCCVR